MNKEIKWFNKEKLEILSEKIEKGLEKIVIKKRKEELKCQKIKTQLINH